jgi:23S rRNA pseudouridine1911/1915/1917 synthase
LGSLPGIVHRLDKDTSGLMIIAKNNEAFQYFKNLFKEKKIEKTYIALVYGRMEKREGVIEFPIRRSRTNPVKQVAVKGGKSDSEAREAITGFKVLKYLVDKAGNQYTLLEAMPKTGRMHQIRAHFAAIGHSIVGDDIYKLFGEIRPEKAKRHLLHAALLRFTFMSGEKKEFSSPLPEDFSGFVKELTESIDPVK